MARFRGTVRGNRQEASRLGTPNSGLITTCNGWNVGIECLANKCDNDQDIIHVYVTGGSNAYSSARLIATVKSGDDGPIIELEK